MLRSYAVFDKMMIRGKADQLAVSVTETGCLVSWDAACMSMLPACFLPSQARIYHLQWTAHPGQ